jgi:hypothetical protein
MKKTAAKAAAAGAGQGSEPSAEDEQAAKQSALDAIESADAKMLLEQVSKVQDRAAQIRIAKRWLKKHWCSGWQAAGGPSGAPPEPEQGTP